MQREVDAGLLMPTDSDWTERVYGQQSFAGAGKSNRGMLVPLERRLTAFLLPRIPVCLETYHLTLLTPLWAILMASLVIWPPPICAGCG